MRKKQTPGKDIVYCYNRNDDMILFGLAGRVNVLMNNRITWDHIKEWEKDCIANGIKKPPVDLFRKFVDNYRGDLNKILKVEMLPEFTWIPKGTPFAKISNLVDGFEPLTTYWEGFLTKAYFPSTVLTKLYKFKEEGFTGIHNFSYRSTQTESSAMLVDIAFLMLYNGTDSFHVNKLLREARNDHLNTDAFEKWMPYKEILKILKPRSIAASNHQTVQSFKHPDTAYCDIIEVYSNDSVASIIDTYGTDYYFEYNLRINLIRACQHNTNFFMRLDSGDMEKQLEKVLTTIVEFKVENSLMNRNSTPKLAIILGDSMDFDKCLHYYQVAKKILSALKKQYKVDELEVDDYVYFGVGSAIANGITRDTVGWVTKLGWSTNSGNSMKTAVGKNSLIGDLGIYRLVDDYEVDLIANADSHFHNHYLDWKDAVTMGNFEKMQTGQLVKHKLVISQDVNAAMDKFKQRFILNS